MPRGPACAHAWRGVGEVSQEPDVVPGLGWRQGAGDTHGPVLRGRAGSSACRATGNQGWAGGVVESLQECCGTPGVLEAERREQREPG